MDMDVIVMPVLYPVMLNLNDVPVLVAGGGPVAERKVASLLEANAKITVISETLSDRIEKWGREGIIDVYVRNYKPGDAAHFRLVFAATNDSHVNEQIVGDAKQSGCWVNAAGDQRLSSMIDPASIRKGKLCIAVSTSGASPTIAANITRQLEAHYGDEYEKVLDFLYTLRMEVKTKYSDDRQRKQFFREIAQIDWIEKFRSGELDMSIQKWMTYFESNLSL